jgi:glycosyltransferase involved in cell wall biosynthesis
MGGWAAGASALALRLGRWADVVVASSPSLLAALPGMAAGVVGKPWVFEVRDLWPESAVAMGVLAPDGLLTRVLYGLEAAACGGAARVVAVTPAIGADLVRRGLVAGERVAVIPNGADLELLSPGEPEEALMEELGWSGRFVALYLGAHGLANGLDQLIDAAEALGEREDILIVAMGDGPERGRLIEETARRGLSKRLHWLPSVPRGEVVRYLRGAGCGLAVLRGASTFRTVYPNKLFDAMACGKPVVCNIEGAAAELVREASGGLCVEPEAPEALAGAICWLADHRDEAARMGQDGLRHVRERFSRERLARAYLELLNQVFAESRRG